MCARDGKADDEHTQGSIRAEFKRMAQVLAGIEGVEKRADALKKAWNVPDPK